MSLEHSGRGTDAKNIMFTLLETEGEQELHALSSRDVSALLTAILPLDWRKRHTQLPADITTQEELDRWTDDLRKRLMLVINFCERMINCIDNDTDVQEALRQWLLDALQDAEVQQNITNITYYNSNPGLPSKPETSGNILTLADCDKDTAAGFIKEGIVDLSIDLIEAMFNAMELASDHYEAKSAFLDLIPAVGELLDFILIQDLLTYAGNIGDWIRDAFNAENTPARREQTYRDLLCLYMDNGCKLSIEDIRDYFFKKATEVNTDFNDALGTAIDLYNFLVNGTTTSFSGIWYIMHAIQFGGAYFIGNLFGMSATSFKLEVLRGEPTNDWIVWEANYGVCECTIIYRKPENPIPDLTTEPGFGLIGIEDALATSTHESGTTWIITQSEPELIEVTGAIGFRFIFDTSDPVFYQIYCDTALFASDGTGGTTNKFSVYYKPGLWMTDIKLSTPFTGFINIFNIRKEIGLISDFKWKEFHVIVPC